MNLARLVTTADDVGLHAALTDGALRAHDQGIVTAVSVAACGEALDAAIAALRSRPELDLGVHLVLVGERPLSPPSEIPSLVDRRGRLLPGFLAFARRALLGGLVIDQVRLELNRQIEALLERGLVLRHLNSHQHLHAWPAVADIVVELARRHAIPWLRIPAEGRPDLSLRGLEMQVLDRLASGLRRRASALRLNATDRTIGIARAGHFRLDVLDDSLAGASDRSATVELVVHPSVDDRAVESRYGWGYHGERELQELTRGDVARQLADRHLVAARFRDLCDSLAP